MTDDFSPVDDVRSALAEYLDSPNASVEAAVALDRLVEAINDLDRNA